MLFFCAAFCLSAAMTAASQTMPADDVSHAVIAELQQRMQPSGRRLNLVVLGRLPDQVLPLGDVRVEVGAIAGPWPRPKIGIPVTLLVDGQKVRSMTMWLGVHMPQRALVFGSDYAAGSSTDTLQLVEADVDLACCAGTPAVLAQNSGDFRLRRSVRAGQPLMQDDVEGVPDVQARSSVEIEVVRGSIRLATTGRALSDGRVGGMVDVLPDGTKSSVRTRVVARQKVAINE
jgi:flagellar basal body P-ring formation protein FlgA